MTNYYELLEISTNASDEVIRMAYKALVKKYHPDSYNGDLDETQKIMAEINQAYEVLSDREKRAEYDKQFSFDERKTEDSDKADERGTSVSPYDRNPQPKTKIKSHGFFGGIIAAIGELISSVIGVVILYVIIGWLTGNLTKWNINLLYYTKTAIHFVQQLRITEKYDAGSAEAALNEYIRAIVTGDDISAKKYIDTDNAYLVNCTEGLAEIFEKMDMDVSKVLAEDMRSVRYEIVHAGLNCAISIKSKDYETLFKKLSNADLAGYEEVYEALNDDKKFEKYLLYGEPFDNIYEATIRMKNDGEKWMVADIENVIYLGNALTGNMMEYSMSARGIDFKTFMDSSAFWSYAGIWRTESGKVYLSLSWETTDGNGTAALTFYEDDGSFVNINMDLKYVNGKMLGESMDYPLKGRMEIKQSESRDILVVSFAPDINMDNESRSKYRIDNSEFVREFSQ